ncbi:MAG: HAD family hydrolase [Candidatus Rokubacteria bacterium]|nr:HAD family hydrolase [Candidatus Rokubacteria bacterium]MBI3825672.1 HAD family hydrolase [Candidatus Rokubacteria bacterium]
MRALLLDLDDTLLDYSGDIDVSWRVACTTGCAGSRVDAERLVTAVEASRRAFWDDPARFRAERVNMFGAWRKIVEGGLARLGIEDLELATHIATGYEALRRERMRLFPDALATLEHLCERGVPLGLVTNGDASQQRYKLERWDLAKYFDVIVIEGEFGAGKPDEVVYRHALDALGVAAAETWMAGDHLEFDVAGPQRLGVRGAWLDRAGAGLPDGVATRPDRIIRALTELVADHS